MNLDESLHTTCVSPAAVPEGRGEGDVEPAAAADAGPAAGAAVGRLQADHPRVHGSLGKEQRLVKEQTYFLLRFPCIMGYSHTSAREIRSISPPHRQA